MHTTNLASLDLNLLVTLEALLEEAHVGRAARRVGLSQPAASHALGRLRALVDDPILVRQGSRMHLTPRAEALRGPLGTALHQVRGLFVQPPFEPESSARRFVISMPDHVVDLLLPPLLDRTQQVAPRIRIDVAPWAGLPGPGSDVDFVIACAPSQFGGPAASGFVGQPLFSDTEAIAVQRGAPANRMARLLKAGNPRRVFEEFLYVAVVGRGLREDLVDTWLREEHDFERAIGLVVPSYLQALHMAARSGLALFVPLRLLDSLAKPLGLRVFASPVDPGLYHETLFQPVRTQQDPGANWLKGHILAVGARLDRSSTG